MPVKAYAETRSSGREFSMGTRTNSSNGPRNPVKDTLLPDQAQIVRNNTIPSERRPANSCFLYLEYSFSPNFVP